MPVKEKCRGSCGAIWRWEEASESLTNALARYQRSCTSLQDSILIDNTDSDDIASRIDASLKTLHVKIANELVQSRLTLVRVRNKISSRFYSLPKKILAQIFMDVIYIPSSEDRSRSMSSELHRIYSRLHTLLRVCTTWRNVGMTHQPLWAIIPVYEGWFGRSKYLAPRLSIDRSAASRHSNTGIHLAALINREHGGHIPLLEGGKPRFDTVNVMSKSARALLHFLDDLVKVQGPWPTRQRLHMLSLYQVREGRRRTKGPKEYPNIFYDCAMYTVPPGQRNPLPELFTPLSILRVRGARMIWDQIKFSSQLVELHLQSVNFDSNSQLLNFLQAINSAPELRDLKIISVIVFPESDPKTNSVECPVPKLQTLLLQDLDFNVLQTIQTSLAPGSYRTTLCLTDKTTCLHIPREEPVIVDIKDLCKVLKRISVDKLVLEAEWGEKVWLDHTGLRRVLQSLPTVKTLIMNTWRFREEDLIALERPRSGGKGSKGTTVRFPNLTALYLVDAQMLVVEPLKNAVTSHKLQKMSLSGCIAPPPENNADSNSNSISGMDTDGSEEVDDFKDALDWNYFEPKDEIIKWLKTKIAQFSLEGVPDNESKDYNTSEWQLW